MTKFNYYFEITVLLAHVLSLWPALRSLAMFYPMVIWNLWLALIRLGLLSRALVMMNFIFCVQTENQAAPEQLLNRISASLGSMSAPKQFELRRSMQGQSLKSEAYEIHRASRHNSLNAWEALPLSEIMYSMGSIQYISQNASTKSWSYLMQTVSFWTRIFSTLSWSMFWLLSCQRTGRYKTCLPHKFMDVNLGPFPGPCGMSHIIFSHSSDFFHFCTWLWGDTREKGVMVDTLSISLNVMLCNFFAQSIVWFLICRQFCTTLRNCTELNTADYLWCQALCIFRDDLLPELLLSIDCLITGSSWGLTFEQYLSNDSFSQVCNLIRLVIKLLRFSKMPQTL